MKFFFLLILTLSVSPVFSVELSLCKKFENQVKDLFENKKVKDTLRHLIVINEKDFCNVRIEIGGRYLKQSQYTFSYEQSFQLELRIFSNEKEAIKEHSQVTKINQKIGNNIYQNDFMGLTLVFLQRDNAGLYYRLKHKKKPVKQYPIIINLAKKLIGKQLLSPLKFQKIGV